MKLLYMLMFLLLSIGTCYADIAIKVVNKSKADIQSNAVLSRGKAELIRPHEIIGSEGKNTAITFIAKGKDFAGDIAISDVLYPKKNMLPPEKSMSYRVKSICWVNFTQWYQTARARYGHNAWIQRIGGREPNPYNPYNRCDVERLWGKNIKIPTWEVTVW